MDKEDVACVCNGILLNHQKEWNLAICKDVNGATEYYAKWNSQRKTYIPYDFSHMCNLRNKTDGHKGRGKKRGRQTIIETLKDREQTEGWWRDVGRGCLNGWWGLRGHLLLCWALNVICKWWITKFYSWNQYHTIC